MIPIFVTDAVRWRSTVPYLQMMPRMVCIKQTMEKRCCDGKLYNEINKLPHFCTKENTNCSAYRKCRHYLRTLMSRKNREKLHNIQKSRLDYKSKLELLNIARQSATKVKHVKMKNTMLELAVKNMVEVGPNSNDDLKAIFNQLYTGMQDNRNKQASPACLWKALYKTSTFKDVEDLYCHCKSHAEHIDTARIAPAVRKYKS